MKTLIAAIALAVAPVVHAEWTQINAEASVNFESFYPTVNGFTIWGLMTVPMQTERGTIQSSLVLISYTCEPMMWQVLSAAHFSDTGATGTLVGRTSGPSEFIPVLRNTGHEIVAMAGCDARKLVQPAKQI